MFAKTALDLPSLRPSTHNIKWVVRRIGFNAMDLSSRILAGISLVYDSESVTYKGARSERSCTTSNSMKAYRAF